MTTQLEEEKKKIEQQKKRVQLKEKLLKQKESQQKSRRISEIIEVAFKTQIHQLDDMVLLGAFLEIADKIHDEGTLNAWRKAGELHKHEQIEKADIHLAISFNTDPGKELRDQLKQLKFRWNSFRHEFHGYGIQEELEHLLQGTDHSIEILS